MTEPTSRCRDLYEHASDLVDKQLSAEDWASLEQHLALCPPCEEYVRQIGITVASLRRLPGAPGQEAREELLRRFRVWSSERTP